MWLLFLTAWLFRSLIFLPRRYIRSFIFISTNQLRALCNRTGWESESYKKSYAAVRYKFVYLLDVKRDLRYIKIYFQHRQLIQRGKREERKNQYFWHCRHHMHINMIMCRPWQWNGFIVRDYLPCSLQKFIDIKIHRHAHVVESTMSRHIQRTSYKKGLL